MHLSYRRCWFIWLCLKTQIIKAHNNWRILFVVCFFLLTREQSIKPASVTVRNGNAGIQKKSTKGKAKEWSFFHRDLTKWLHIFLFWEDLGLVTRQCFSCLFLQSIQLFWLQMSLHHSVLFSHPSWKIIFEHYFTAVTLL